MIRFGIIGTNFISDRFVEAAKQTNCAIPVSVYSRGEESGELFVKKHGLEKSYTSLESLLKSDVDAIYVASPTFCHESQAIQSLRAGKHVLCEKMLASSFSGGVKMHLAAKEQGLVLVEAMRTAFDPAIDIIKGNLKQLGKIRRAKLEYCQYSSRYDKFKSGIMTNAFNPEIANSALADIGIYPLHLALSLFGEPDTVRAESVFLHNGFEGMGKISLSYSDMLTEVIYSKITESVTPSVIEGEDGSITFDKINAPTEINLIKRNGDCIKLDYKPASNNMIYEISAFCDMIKGKGEPDRYMSVSLEALKVVDIAYKQTGASNYFKI